MKKFRFSLKIKLTVIILAVTLVFILIQGTAAVQNSTKAVDESVKGRLMAVAENVANQANNSNEKEFMALRVLSEVPEIRDTKVPLERKTEILSAVVKEMGDSYENIAFYDAAGNSIMRNGKKINLADRQYIKNAMNGMNSIVDPFVNPVDNTEMMIYAVPVKNLNGQPVGSLVMMKKGNPMLDFCKAINLGDNMHPAIVNRKTGETIANANPMTEDEGSNVSELDTTQGLGLVMSHVMEGQTGNDSFIDPFTHAHITSSYTPIAESDWSVFCAAPYDYYYKQLNNLKKIMTIILIAGIILVSVICIIVITVLFKPLLKVRDAIQELSSGNADLTQRLPAASNDEIGDVVNGVNMFIEKLQNIMKKLKESKEQLKIVSEDLSLSSQDASAAITQITANIESVDGQIVSQAGSVQETAGAVNEISSNIESLEKMIESQSSGVTQASAAVEEMIGNINSVNSAVEKMVASFSLLEQNTGAGISTQNNANEKIRQIEEESKSLQDANSAIANIAEQTNLLAMNAAIEAAHAGEAGKGFSVVADEIRKLSETSSAQSKSIGEELSRIQDTIELVVSASGDTNAAFTSVSQSISDTGQIIQQIKAAMEEQQIGSKQIIEALQAMNNSTSEVKTASAEMTAGNKQILQEVSRLQNASDTMKGSVTEMQTGARRINETGATLSTITGRVTESLDAIGSQIDLFKV